MDSLISGPCCRRIAIYLQWQAGRGGVEYAHENLLVGDNEFMSEQVVAEIGAEQSDIGLGGAIDACYSRIVELSVGFDT